MLAREIDSKGPAAFLAQSTSGDGVQWQALIGEIQTGSQAWLRIAAKLLPVTDAGNTADLHFALSIALTQNPQGVLALTGPDLPVEKVCSVLHTEPDKATVAQHKKKVRAALQKLTQTAQEPTRNACLKALER